jgi:uncharacterized membrane protein YuzA (DUF378 family)
MMQNVVLVLALLVIVGALNWLLVGLDEKYNLVHRLLGNADGTMSNAERAVYILVGLAGLVLLGMKLFGKTCCGCGCEKCGEPVA